LATNREIELAGFQTWIHTFIVLLTINMATSNIASPSTNREECWPDWVSKGEVIVDDVSRLNATKVSRVYQVRSIDDVQRIVKAAKEQNQMVCVRGTKHSMGGHTMSLGAAVIDMEYVTSMELSPDGSVTVGTGAKWADLILYLNKFGKAPRTLQSYCSFSIGGTMSVNGHGITTDFCLAESVISFRLIKYDGTLVNCSRTAESEEARELFKCCIGGYGLFGIIFDVTLKTNDNVRLFMDTMMVPLGELPIIYEGLRSADDIEVKLARINITNFDLGEIYIFRRHCPTPTVSNLSSKPLEMSNTSRLLYKWFAGPLREVRFAVEQQLGVALDWSEVVDRNLLLFESAAPLARLYSPLLLVDDTFILQEYFVPKENFNSWISEAKNIVMKQINQEKLLTLLNITIRVVEHDNDSMLPYSASKQGSYAFVLYYRLRRTHEATQLLASYHDKLASITLAEGGTFYLPYQHHYSKEQLLAAYPGFDHFCSLKNKYDPEGRFSNLWWEHYALDRRPDHVMHFAEPVSAITAESMISGSNASASSNSSSTADETSSESPKKEKKKKKTAKKVKMETIGDASSQPLSSSSSSSSDPSFPEFEKKQVEKSYLVVDLAVNLPTKTLGDSELTALFTGVSVHRSDSFRKLMKDSMLRQQFLDVFLTEVLSIGNNTQLFRLINRAIWDPRLKDDDQIYMSLFDGLSESTGPISSLAKAWKNVKQLSDQKRELVRETVSALSRLGRFGKIHTMCSIGDHGKLVVRLRSDMNIKGHVWVVHDKEGSDSDIGAILERGSQTPGVIGEFVPINYDHIKKDGREFAAIPDGVVDLVTMNQGLHHLPPAQVKDFLTSVHRILRPGGIFITREHDLDEKKELMPMLDCAHMVFNALTGVAPPLERSEIRGFRSVMEWRTLVESCGFRDSLIYEMQPNDPTKDIMLSFIKVGDGVFDPSKRKFSPALTSKHSIRTLTDPLRDSIQLLDLPPAISSLGPNMALNQLPRIGLTGIKGTLQTLQNLLPTLQAFLVNAVDTLIPKDIPGLAESVKLIVNNYVGPALMMLARFEPLTEAAVPNTDFAGSYVPEELFLLLQVLRSRSQQGGIFELAIISIIDRISRKFLDKKEEKPKLPRPDSSASVSEDASPSAIAEASEISEAEVRAEITLLLQTYPQLADLHQVIRGLGLASSATSLMISMAPTGGSVDSFTAGILKKLDKTSWVAFKEGIRTARQEGKLPTMEALNTPGNGWNRLMMGYLSSPHIQISRTQSFMASAVGLGDLVSLWNKAQAQRTKTSKQQPGNRLPSPAVQTLDEICPVRHYEGKGLLEGVLHVVSARFVKKSLTRFFNANDQDVTASAQLALKSDGTLNTEDIEIDKSLLLGGSKFVIEYRTLPDISSSASTVRKIGHQLGQLLVSSGHIDGNLNVENETRPWFKLSEWMQVEIVQMFGDSMNHTPWYRFPFVEVFKIYFQVLFKCVGVVAEKKGYMSALSDKGFIIDAIPGVVMGFLFAQMQLLALPLKSSLGGAYNPSELVEQLLVMVPSKPSWAHIDKRIVPLTEFDQGLSVLQIPTFKPFTEVLTSIAIKCPTAIILQISNHASVHVKMELQAKRAEDIIKQFGLVKGVTVNFNYKFPSVCCNPDASTSETAVSDPPIYVSVSVQVPALLAFIRRCHEQWPTAKVYQVYDFF
jgi:FAD/FMN-containing dehydrogenase/SAM-dependent methyltransferase